VQGSPKIVTDVLRA